MLTIWIPPAEETSSDSVQALGLRFFEMIFIDESIQHSLDYICVGFAYCKISPEKAIKQAISKAGLVPGIDEYKSGARMVNATARRSLRENIARIVLERCRLGLYVAPVSERPVLLNAVVEIAEKIILRNGLSQPQKVFVDEGFLGHRRHDKNAILGLELRCDSKKVVGIQLADFVAYHCSYLLKCALIGSSKKVIIDEAPHPLTNEEVELDWIIRTELRRNFFVEYRDVDAIADDDWFFKLAGYGAFFSPSLSAHVKSAAMETFDSMYFGCVW